MPAPAREPKTKSALSVMLKESPFQGRWIAQQLGIEGDGWWQIRSGQWRMPRDKQKALAALIGRPLAEIEQAVEETVKQWQQRKQRSAPRKSRRSSG